MTSGTNTADMTRITGRWSFADMDQWDPEGVDPAELGFIEFRDDGMGEFGFLAVRGELDGRPGEHRDGVEFTWEGADEGDPVCGRGWAALVEDGSLRGHLYIHLGDDSAFRAVRGEQAATQQEQAATGHEHPAAGQEPGAAHPTSTGQSVMVSPAEAARLEDEIEQKIEAALAPDRFVPDYACFEFVNGLEKVEAEVAGLVEQAPLVAVGLYETFMAGCHEKAEEIDDSSGSLGDFVGSLARGWITARQAAGAAADDTAARLLSWMDDDTYGFFHRLEAEAAAVLNDSRLAALTAQVRALLDASEDGEDSRGYVRRRWAEVLRTLHEARGDIDGYFELAERTGPTARDCHTVATMLAARGDPGQALAWVERGTQIDARDTHGGSAGDDLATLKPRLLARMDRDDDALAMVWDRYRDHPARHSFEEFMTFVPRAERRSWHRRAIEAAIGDDHLPSVMDLLAATEETDRLAAVARGRTDADLQHVGHVVAESAAQALETGHPLEAARLWGAQGMRILAAKKNKHYPAALRDFERAKQCYEAADSADDWRRMADRVRAEHGGKYSFMPSFEDLAAGSGPSDEPTFLQRAKTRWATGADGHRPAGTSAAARHAE